MSERNDTELAMGALQSALERGDGPPPDGHHTDRGSPYASDDYRKTLAARGISCSMSRKGNCWDNAVAESFFSTLKVECLHRQSLMSRASARLMVFDFIEVFYNRQRRHSALGYMTPEEYANSAKPS